MFAATADPGGPYDGVVGTAVDMEGIVSCAPGEGNIISIDWAFGDGTIISVGVSTTTGPVTVTTTSHTYTAPDVYDVTLTVGCATDTGAVTPTTAIGTTTATIESDCIPETQCSPASECGVEDDGCGGTIDCGTCDAGESCVENICVEAPDIDCECDADWKNHGQYVRCVAQAAGALVKDGSITEEEKDEIVEEAAESDCGKKQLVEILFDSMLIKRQDHLFDPAFLQNNE